MPGTMALLVWVAIAGGCSGANGHGANPRGAIDLSVFAAASLRDALADIKTAYEAVTPGVTLTIATDSSATMRAQIEQGAPADVFLSADVTNPGALASAGLADGEPVVFARNQLALIVPAGNPGAISSPADLAKPGIRIIAAGNEVPITGYAGQLLADLARLSGYPSDFVAACAANIVSKEENVRSVVAKIQLGEGDAAIVYLTDASTSEDVVAIDIPAAANVDASYAAVVVRATASASQAHAFLDWLTGRDGVARLTRFGFLPPT
jgi:molybdate transport system substrate-binding protein